MNSVESLGIYLFFHLFPLCKKNALFLYPRDSYVYKGSKNTGDLISLKILLTTPWAFLSLIFSVSLCGSPYYSDPGLLLSPFMV